MSKITCFKAYDIRGQLGTELNEEITYHIARAFAQWLKPKNIVIGGDIRPTTNSLKTALANGLMDEGVDVIDIGLTGTEEIYFATAYLKTSGGIEVTASHNPIDYNGFKFVREGSRPISADTGLKDIQALAETLNYQIIDGLDPHIKQAQRGSYQTINTKEAYVKHLLSYIDLKALTPMKIVVNPGNGVAGPVVEAIEKAFKLANVPIEFIKINFEPDGQFPNGIPNPILVENRQATHDAVLANKATLGIAWDGDFDRCFLFDEQGQFIEGYYIVGLLAEAFLQKEQGASIILDPRMTWNTLEIIANNHGHAIKTKAGHAFIKETMRKHDAIYGGEMSAHHYFRDFFYCDSGMIPWLLIIELMSRKQQPLSALVNARIEAYPSSGEINLTVSDAQKILAALEQKYGNTAKQVEHIDGLGIDYDDWRFNLRASNTEPLIRLNVESRGNRVLLKEKTKELLDFIKQL